MLINLPPTSRFYQYHIESKDWDWDKEVQSRILLMLDVISCQLSNMAKKKGQKPRKPAEQFQPDYVKNAKKSIDKHKREQNLDDLADLEEIFSARNKNINKLGD